MKIFITGATGFLGSNLAKLLVEKGEDVTVLMRHGSSHPFLSGLALNKVEGDLADFNSILTGMNGCTHVFHTAGYLSYSKVDKNRMIEINVNGTRNVCRAALENNIKKLVHVSSTSAVGIPDDINKPAGEDHTFHKRWNKLPYMYTKRLSEEVALGFVKEGLNVVVVNPSTFYGPGDIKVHSGEVFKNIAAGSLRIAPPGGTGIVSILDCAEGLIAAMERGETGHRYVLNGENLTILQIFNTVAELLDKPPINKTFPIWSYPPIYGFAYIIENIYRIFGRASKIDSGTIAMAWRHRYFDNSKAQNKLLWKPRISFRETCKQAIEFYRSEGILERV